MVRQASAAAALSLCLTGSAGAQVICPDVDASGTVGILDLFTVLGNFCAPGPFCDTNFDGIVDWLDMLAVFRCFGLAGVPPVCVPAPGCPGPALTTQFRLEMVDTGGCPGGPLPIGTADGSSFYQHPGGSNFPPTSAQVASDPTIQFDTYVAAGGAPTTFGSPPPMPVNAIGNGFSGMWNLSAAWYPDNGPEYSVSSAAAPLLLNLQMGEGLFVGQLTTRRGVGLIRCDIRVALQDSTGLHVASFRLNGPPVSVDVDGNMMASSYGIRSFILGQPSIVGFGDVDVHNIYVVSGAIGGDEDGDFCVSFNDVTSVLANWLRDYRPCSGPGDANGDGVVDFSDVTYTLAWFRNPYVCL